MQILKGSPWHIAALVNLKALKGSTNDRFLVEHRITAPFSVSEALVTKEDNPIFCGFEIIEEDDDEVHICFELKEKGHEFVPVTVDGEVVDDEDEEVHCSPQRKSMFASKPNLRPFPEHISHSSESANKHNDDDDASAIATQEQNGRFKTTGLDENLEKDGDEADDEESWDSDLDKDGMSIDKSENSEMRRLRQRIKELSDIVSGLSQCKQSKSQHSDDAKNTAGTPKKKKNNDGDASVAGSRTSRHSTATRGTQAREEKRKAPNSRDDSSKKDK